MKKPITLLLLLLSFTGFSQAKLQYNLTSGDSFTIRQNSDQTITQKIPSGEQIIINDMSADMSFLVTKVENDLIYLEMTYEVLKLKMSSPTLGVLMNIDTSIEPDPTDIQGRVFQGLIDCPVTIIMQENGKINAIEGTTALIDNMIDNAKITNPQTIEKIRSNLSKQWGSNVLIGNFEQMTYIYGHNEATIGDVWENEYTGKMKTKNKWKIAAIKDEKTTITSTAEVKLENIDPNASMIASGSQETKIIVRSKTGIISEGNTRGTCIGNTIMPTMPDTKIPTTIEFINNYKTIK